MDRRAGIERELASRADQRVLRWFGKWKEWMSTIWRMTYPVYVTTVGCMDGLRGVDGRSRWGAGTRET